MTTWVERVLALEPTFRRAPSAHNTQPATLRIEQPASDAIVVGWSPDRELVVGDPTRRDLWLALGAFVESVVVAAASAGLGVDVAWGLDARGHVLARLTEGPLVDPVFTADELLARRCARGPYAAPSVAADEVSEVAQAAGLSGGADGASLVVVPSGVVDELLPVADRWTWSPPGLVSETRSWVRLDHDDPRYLEDGLTDVALALTPTQARLLRVVTSERVWPVLRRAGGPSLMATSSVIEGRGTVVALAAPADAATVPADVAGLGRVLLRTWLAAARDGLAVHPLSVLVDSPLTAPRVRRAVTDELAGRGGRGAAAPTQRVLSVFRIGRPVESPPESHRRPVPVS